MNTITIVGGGLYTIKLIQHLAATCGIERLHIKLIARRFARLRKIAGYAARSIADRKSYWTIQACAEQREALEKTDIVVLLLRVGGLQARSRDEQFPVAFGLAGDEGLGVGGMANAWRSFPVMQDWAQAIARWAPSSVVLNMVAPLGVTTRLIKDYVDGPVWGVCELPMVTRQKWSEGSEGLHYLGYNHLGWLWGNEKALDRGLRLGDIDRAVLEAYEAAPLHYFYRVIDTAAGERLKISANPNRAKELSVLSEDIYAQLDQDGPIAELQLRSTPWFDVALIPIISALCTNTPWEGTLNVPNQHFNWLPEGSIVEVDVRIEAQRVQARPPSAPPPPVQAFLSNLGVHEEGLFQACTARDKTMLHRALQALPVCLDGIDQLRLLEEICRPV